ncbi:hypothetical protein BCR44DRAFT_29037, partial [Catenaria anguillulae PL171]
MRSNHSNNERGSGKLLNLTLMALFLICALQVFPLTEYDLTVSQAWPYIPSSFIRRAVAATTPSSDSAPATTATSSSGSGSGSNSGSSGSGGSNSGSSNTGSSDGSSSSPTSSSNAPAPSTTSGGTTNPGDSNTIPVSDNPDDIVVDPLTPAGRVKFIFPFTYVKPEDMTLFPINKEMTIKWEWKDVLIMPRLITIQINSPGQFSKVTGSQIKTPEDRWFPVAVNITGDRDEYKWMVNVTDRAGYQLRLFDSEVGPVFFGKPGRLGLTVSSKFNLYIEGRDPSYLEMFSGAEGGRWGERVSVTRIVGVLTGVAALAYWL